MFTVKHVTLGMESLIAVRSATFLPAACQPQVPAEDEMNLVLLDGTEFTLRGGIVFVMNESGKTVSKYDLNNASAARVLAARHEPITVTGLGKVYVGDTEVHSSGTL